MTNGRRVLNFTVEGNKKNYFMFLIKSTINRGKVKIGIQTRESYQRYMILLNVLCRQVHLGRDHECNLSLECKKGKKGKLAPQALKFGGLQALRSMSNCPPEGGPSAVSIEYGYI